MQIQHLRDELMGKKSNFAKYIEVKVENASLQVVILYDICMHIYIWF